MSGKKKRDVGGAFQVDGLAFLWSVKSEPAWNTSDGDIGLRLSIMKDDAALNRHGERKAWRELILQFPFEKPKHASRFPERPRVEPDQLTRAIRLAMAAGWEPHSRGRTFELVLEESDLPEQ